MMTYRELSDKVKSNRGILALLRTRPDRLTPQQLHTLLMHRSMNKDWCRKTIPQFLEMMDALKKSPFKALATLGKTFYLWKDEDCQDVAI
jgi:transposase